MPLETVFIEVQQINERTPLKNKFLYPKSAYRQFAMAIKSKGTQYHEERFPENRDIQRLLPVKHIYIYIYIYIYI